MYVYYDYKDRLLGDYQDMTWMEVKLPAYMYFTRMRRL